MPRVVTRSSSSTNHTMPYVETASVLDHRKRRRNRTTQSCLNCHTSKRKCDRKRPCSRCIQLGLTGLCVYEVDDVTARDDPDTDEKTRLKGRVAELERLVRELRGKPHPKWSTKANADSMWHGRARSSLAKAEPVVESETEEGDEVTVFTSDALYSIDDSALYPPSSPSSSSCPCQSTSTTSALGRALDACIVEHPVDENECGVVKSMKELRLQIGVGTGGNEEAGYGSFESTPYSVTDCSSESTSHSSSSYDYSHSPYSLSSSPVDWNAHAAYAFGAGGGGSLAHAFYVPGI